MPGRVLLDSLASRTNTQSQSAMDHLKRTSLSGLASLKAHTEKRHHSKERNNSVASTRQSTRSPSLKPVKSQVNSMSIIIESPPNVFYGNPAQSSGALFSGQIRVKVNEPEITINRFTMEFLACISALKPVVKDCSDCGMKTTQLFRWTFLSEPKTLKTGEHSFPFSYLIPGHLPATTFGHLGRLEYMLNAVAKTTAGENIVLRQALPISRALPPAQDKTSLRIFPPTNLTAHLQFAPIIHPIGDSTVMLRITGITAKAPNDPDIQLRWRLRKLSWRLEETEKMVSPACARHSGKVGGEGRGVMHEDTRVLGNGEAKEGWKTDFDDGNIEMEFTVRPNGSSRPLCDVESPTGLSVIHNIVIELVIAEEWAPKKHPSRTTPTGAARVLRASFQVAITERAGMGISWDEEQPPTYEDVPASPPLYSTGGPIPVAGEMSPLGEVSPLEELDELSLGDAHRPSAAVDPSGEHGRGRERGRPSERVMSPNARARELRDIMEEGNAEYDRPPSAEPSRDASPAREA